MSHHNPDQKRTVRFPIVASEAEADVIRRAADVSGLPPTVFMRMAALKMASDTHGFKIATVESPTPQGKPPKTAKAKGVLG